MKKTRKLILLSLFTAISVIIGIFEASLPIIHSIPGGKLGITNAIFIILLYKYGILEAFVVNILRTLITSLLYGGANAFIYSFSGALISSFVIVLLSFTLKEKVSPLGLSVIGAFFHNLTQVSVAAIMLGSTSVYYYFTVLAYISIISGTVTGIFAKYFLDFTKGEVYR